MTLATCSRRSNYLASSYISICDFLVPNFAQFRSTRRLSTFPKASTAGSETSIPEIVSSSFQPSRRHERSLGLGSDAVAKPAQPGKPLTQAQRNILTKALRVNHAGELAATLIYASQTPPLVASYPHLRPLMKHMYDQEAGHFETFNKLLARHRIRPTAMYPIWSVISSVLGWSTAVLGREAAMACTEAVETEIGEHYNAQVRTLLNMIDGMKRDDEEVGSELRELLSTIRKIRDEELEHLDHAVENDAKNAVPHALLTGIIRAGCKGAIWISERV